MDYSTSKTLKLLVFLILIVAFATIYKASIPYFLKDPSAIALHYIGIGIIFFGILFIAFIVIDSLKDNDNGFL